MNEITKVWLIIATCLLVVGCIIFTTAMTMMKWDFSKFSTDKYVTNTYDIKEGFKNLSLDTDTADITFLLSEDGKCTVECFEEEKSKHSVSVKDDTLVIKMINEKSWYDYISISFAQPKLTVYLPESEYSSLIIREDTGDITLPKEFLFDNVDITLSTGKVDFSAPAAGVTKIKTTTGNISVSDTYAKSLELGVTTGDITVTNAKCEGDVTLSVSTGKTTLTDIECKNLLSDGSTGDLVLKNVMASEKFSIERSTGDVKFEGADASEIFVETSTGDVCGSLMSEKFFITESDTGLSDVPHTLSGGKCEVKTSTGDIKITVE